MKQKRFNVVNSFSIHLSQQKFKNPSKYLALEYKLCHTLFGINEVFLVEGNLWM